MSAHTHEVPSQEVPTRFQRMLWPSIGVGVTLATTAYVRQVDPNQPGHYLPCPLKFVTGIDCPACGGLRCVHSLTNGDIVGALDHNALAVVVLPLIAVAEVAVTPIKAPAAPVALALADSRPAGKA